MEKDLILTCDAGTTGCKVSVFDAKGTALCNVTRSYPTLYPRPNWAEQDPDRILDAVFGGIRELLQQVNPQRIACVGLSGTMNGCIPVDEAGNVIANTLNYGNLIAAVINFVILALVVFWLVKGLNKLSELGKKKEAPAEAPAPAPAEPSAEEKLLAEIRDLLKEK